MVCPYEELIESILIKFNKNINASCKKLFSLFSLTHFWYSEMTNSGHFFAIGSNAPWEEYLLRTKIYTFHPYFRHPRFFQNEVAVIQLGNEEKVQSFLNTTQQEFHLTSSIQVLEKSPFGFAAFGVATNSLGPNSINTLLRELSLLKLFAQSFKKEHVKAINFGREHAVNIGELLGPLFETNPHPTSEKLQKTAFLQGLGIDQENLPLTLREKEILQFITNGYSASQIATSIHLSKRTVEHHIERIKNKLSCDSKQQLMGKGRELELLHFI